MTAGGIRTGLWRFVLLACTMLGLLALHTAGHVRGHEHGVSMTTVAVADAFAAADHCDRAECSAHPVPFEGHGSTGLWDMSLAVLVLPSLAVLAAPGLVARFLRPSAGRRAQDRPPARRRLGLTLAVDATLRT